MDISTLKKLGYIANSLGSASRHMSAAAADVSKVVLPAMATLAIKVPKLAKTTVETARYGETREERRDAAVKIGVCAFAAVALSAAVIGHFVHKHNKKKQYREYKRQLTAAVKREKAIESTIAGATGIRSAMELIDNQASAGGSENSLDFARKPGCFAILSYDNDVSGEGLALYSDVYVGASSSMLDGALRNLEGKGNLYVGADVSYDRKIYVAFYPCEEYELYANKEVLIQELGAEYSYNKASVLAELD